MTAVPQFASSASIKLHPSPRLAALLTLAHGMAAFSVIAAPLDASLRAALIAAVAFSLARHLPRLALLSSPRSVLGVEPCREGFMQLALRNGECHEVRLAAGSAVFGGSVLLVLGLGDGRSLRLTILHDMCDADGLRRLRTWCIEQQGMPV